MSVIPFMSVIPLLTINGNPLPATVAGHVYHVVYKEGLVFTGDTVSIGIADPDGSFRKNFRLKAAIPVTLSIVSSGKTRTCGTFYIHTVRMKGDKGGGSDITIDCTSIPVKPESSVRTEKKSRGHEKTTLKGLAGKVASESGLGLQYKAADDPKIGRADQHDESDLVFLAKHCQENDFCLKIKDNTLWILDHEALEKQAPAGTLVIPSPGNAGGVNGIGGLTSWELTECTEDIYKAAEVKHKDHKTGKIVTGLCQDPDCADLGITLRDKGNPHHEESTDTDDPSTSQDVVF